MTATAATHDTRHMTYHPDRRELSAYASDLGIRAGVAPAGFYRVRSHRTGRELAFRFARTDKDAEGDIVAWTYRNADQNLTLTVIND